MKLIQIDNIDAARVAPLVADFRVALRRYKGVESQPDVKDAMEEIQEFLKIGYPIFAVEENGQLAGYTVLRIEGPLLWVEHIYVIPEARRRGVATLLFEKAEEVARGMGEDTVFNYVHPNNDGMINFLRSKGYTVLNLIEIRKPFAGEQLTTTIHVENNTFDY